MAKRAAKLGQNFLIDQAATLRIAEALGDIRDRTVVEIGPGHGAISAHLAARCRSLHLVEFDPSLARELAFRFRHNPHVAVHQADILATNLASFAPETSGSLDVIGNLPYYITSDILLHLYTAARQGLLARAVLMTQREVAQRIAAAPGSRDYGALTALTQLHGSVTELFTLPPGAFSPPPDVYSTVFRLDFAPRFEELDLPFEPFNTFLRSTFAQKRKTLLNNLRAAGYTAEQLEAAWLPVLPQQVRSEAVTLDDLAALYRRLSSAAAA